MKIIEADAYLIDHIAQPASDYVHDWTGIDFISQAQWCYRIVATILIAQAFINHTGVGGFVLPILLVIYIEASFPFRRAVIGRNCLNPFRTNDFYGRILGIVTAIVVSALSSDLPQYALWMSYLAGAYVHACTPRPRKPKRLPTIVIPQWGKLPTVIIHSPMLPSPLGSGTSIRVRPTSSRDQKQAAFS